MTSALRPDSWTARDRFLASAFVVYALVGIAHNYARISPRVGQGARSALALVLLAFVGVTLLFFAWEVVRRRRSVETLGFKVGTWRSAALTVVIGAYLAASLIKLPLANAFAAGIVLPFLAVLVEEMLFRPVLITWLHDGLARTRTSWALAVFRSAAIWTAVHLPSKSASMLVGLFVAGVLLGALYAWSGTNVAGYVLHALANSGSGGAVVMFVLCVVLGAGGRLIERRTHPAPEGAATGARHSGAG